MIFLFRVRPELSENVTMMRALKRLLHLTSQHLENSFPGLLIGECPSAVPGESCHPMSQHARRSGNPAMKMALISRFMARGGGYVTTKDEWTLMSAGFVSKDSRIASRTTGEFCARYLARTSEEVQLARQNIDSVFLPIIMDASRVAKVQVISKLK